MYYSNPDNQGAPTISSHLAYVLPSTLPDCRTAFDILSDCANHLVHDYEKRYVLPVLHANGRLTNRLKTAIESMEAARQQHLIDSQPADDQADLEQALQLFLNVWAEGKKAHQKSGDALIDLLNREQNHHEIYRAAGDILQYFGVKISETDKKIVPVGFLISLHAH